MISSTASYTEKCDDNHYSLGNYHPGVLLSTINMN